MERMIESLILGSRWLQVPLYLGLVVALAVLGAKFFEELLALSLAVWGAPESSVVLATLMLVDIVLVANLVIMVVIGGYENFVSKLDIDAAHARLSWLGKLEGGTIKVKLATSIVSISAIHLLGAFINYERVANDKLVLLLAIHLAFVVSATCLAYVDRLAARPLKPKGRQVTATESPSVP